MNITDIIAEFGSYYIKNEANMTRLVKQLNRQSKTDTVLTPFFTDDTIYRASEGRIGRVLQPFQKAWTPIGTMTFVPVAIEMFKMKVDTQEYPDDLEGTWLGFLAGDSIDRKEWPFIRWFIEVFLLPQALEDYEMNEIYKGVFAAPTPGTAGAAGTSMNGIRKAINDQITAGRITPIVMGAMPTTNDATLVTYIEKFVDSIDKRYWNIPMQLAVQESGERAFRRALRAKYGENTDFVGTTTLVPETNITIVGLPSMNGSGKIWCTPKSNALHLKKKTQNQKNVQVENVDRLVKMYTDWWSGVGFVIPEIVFTNDQDLV
jgi:hypothetical protein